MVLHSYYPLLGLETTLINTYVLTVLLYTCVELKNLIIITSSLILVKANSGLYVSEERLVRDLT